MPQELKAEINQTAHSSDQSFGGTPQKMIIDTCNGPNQINQSQRSVTVNTQLMSQRQMLKW